MTCNPIPSPDKSRLLGVVLCGGKSSRMGTDKGLLHKEGQTWVETAYQMLCSLQIPVCVSVNESQSEAYGALLGENNLVQDHMHIGGPLEGLMSVHKTFPDKDLLLLACDMPDIHVNVLENLITVYQDREGEHDFFVYENKGFQEPFPGIYTSEGLGKVFSLLASNQLQKNSLKYLLEAGNTYEVGMQEEEMVFFKNYNEQKDLK